VLPLARLRVAGTAGVSARTVRRRFTGLDPRARIDVWASIE
jgi:hypothetical protein